MDFGHDTSLERVIANPVHCHGVPRACSPAMVSTAPVSANQLSRPASSAMQRIAVPSLAVAALPRSAPPQGEPTFRCIISTRRCSKRHGSRYCHHRDNRPPHSSHRFLSRLLPQDCGQVERYRSRMWLLARFRRLACGMPDAACGQAARRSSRPERQGRRGIPRCRRDPWGRPDRPVAFTSSVCRRCPSSSACRARCPHRRHPALLNTLSPLRAASIVATSSSP